MDGWLVGNIKLSTLKINFIFPQYISMYLFVSMCISVYDPIFFSKNHFIFKII